MKPELKVLEEIEAKVKRVMEVNFDNKENQLKFNNENPEPDGIYHKMVEVTWDDPKTGEKRKGYVEKYYSKITVES